MPPFIVCIHDATPAYESETRRMVRDLAPILGRCFSFAVVPDWREAWPLSAHPDYCQQVREVSEELLLHGYFHQRRRGQGGVVSWLVEGSDEMNGLDAEETRRVLQLGQRAFIDAFGEPAQGFVAPAWQRGHVNPSTAEAAGLSYVLGFFNIETADRKHPLATWTWDCGRPGWLGYVGDALGPALQSVWGGSPSLAIHPRDLTRGYWPRILRLIRKLVEAGYEPTTCSRLIKARQPPVPITPGTLTRHTRGSSTESGSPASSSRSMTRIREVTASGSPRTRECR